MSLLTLTGDEFTWGVNRTPSTLGEDTLVCTYVRTTHVGLYIYIYLCMCVCIYKYMYVFICM
jgi:hypothetical protein